MTISNGRYYLCIMKLTWIINRIEDLYRVPPNLFGVYVIFFKPILPDGNTVTVARYVGESGYCIKGRIKDHIRKKRYGLESYFAYAEIVPSETEEIRKGVERFLYNCYDPLDTKKSPAVDPIVVDLPFVEYLKGWQFGAIQVALTYNYTQVLEQLYKHHHSHHQLV